MSQVTRVCIDCPAGITHRAKQARRCERCAHVAKHRPVEVSPVRICRDCPADISARHPAARRCVPCAEAERLRDKQARYANATTRTRPCCWCEKTFAFRRADTLYCKPECRIRAKRAQIVGGREYVCALCTATFRPTRSDAIYCGTTCGQRASYLRNRAQVITAAAAWNATNVDRRREIAAAAKGKRRAVERSGPGVPVREWRRLLRRYGGRCAYCSCTPTTVHMDHVIPLSRGGRHAIGNVVPACGTCNLSKSSSLLVEWRRRSQHALAA